MHHILYITMRQATLPSSPIFAAQVTSQAPLARHKLTQRVSAGPSPHILFRAPVGAESRWIGGWDYVQRVFARFVPTQPPQRTSTARAATCSMQADCLAITARKLS